MVMLELCKIKYAETDLFSWLHRGGGRPHGRRPLISPRVSRPDPDWSQFFSVISVFHGREPPRVDLLF